MLLYRPAFFLTAFVLLFATACTTPSQSQRLTCTQRDWYELGRRDGSQGATLDRKKSYINECPSDFERFSTIYNNGRNAGLVEYCQTENSFQLGRMGIAYLYVCPSTMESEFLMGYRRGQQARMLEMKKRELDAQIESLAQRLLTATSPERDDLSSQIDTLKQLRAENERELSDIIKSL